MDAGDPPACEALRERRDALRAVPNSVHEHDRTHLIHMVYSVCAVTPGNAAQAHKYIGDSIF